METNNDLKLFIGDKPIDCTISDTTRLAVDEDLDNVCVRDFLDVRPLKCECTIMDEITMDAWDEFKQQMLDCKLPKSIHRHYKTRKWRIFKKHFKRYSIPQLSHRYFIGVDTDHGSSQRRIETAVLHKAGGHEYTITFITKPITPYTL